jgi:hypothetical protein
MEHSSVQLVPPSLAVIAALITHKKDLRHAIAQLQNRAYMGHSYWQLASCNLPLVKVEVAKIGNGLTLAYTESKQEYYFGYVRRGLVWVSELACHPMCAFLGRICQGNLSSSEWLEKIEKKHLEWLDRLPSV